jgi:type I restriction-modification system DNA methylase subunit
VGKITRTKNKVEFGDFQTPRELTNEIAQALSDMGITPKTIIEPTCGEGNFLISAIKQFPAFEHALGFDSIGVQFHWTPSKL